MNWKSLLLLAITLKFEGWKKKIKDGRIKLLYHIKTWLPIRQIIHSLWHTWTIQSLNFSIEHMEHAFSHSICLTFATISMTLARIWTAFSGTRTDLFWLIKPLVTLEKGSGRSLNSIISSRYTSTCTSKINLYYINCMYQFLPYHEFQRIRKWNTGNRLLYYLLQCPWYMFLIHCFNNNQQISCLKQTDRQNNHIRCICLFFKN